MKLTIDFSNKIITVDQQCSAEELFNKLQELFPKDWKEYKLETATHYINYPSWFYPSYQQIEVPPQPSIYPITFGDGN